MNINFEPGNTAPLYHQIASAVRRAIRKGDVSEGDRLPATRDLATSLGVNMHTVVRAYGLLRHEGLLETRRGRGATVAAGATTTAGGNSSRQGAGRRGTTPRIRTRRAHRADHQRVLLTSRLFHRHGDYFLLA